MVTGTLARRGFLRNVALAVGAVLVGVGRSGAVPTTRASQRCTPCSGTPECPAMACPVGTVGLYWQSPAGGKCFECYKSAAAARNAQREGPAEGREPCNYCIDVECHYYTSSGSQGDKEREAWGTDPEDPLGIGCRDPDTGIYYQWPEPGTPCSTLDPTPTPDEPP